MVDRGSLAKHLLPHEQLMAKWLLARQRNHGWKPRGFVRITPEAMRVFAAMEADMLLGCVLVLGGVALLAASRVEGLGATLGYVLGIAGVIVLGLGGARFVQMFSTGESSAGPPDQP